MDYLPVAGIIGEMKRVLQAAAAGLFICSLAGWFFLGANKGWTKTTVTRWQRDAVTGLDGPVIEKKFVPGVELLTVALAVSGILFGIAAWSGSKKGRR
jgi:hypothetical protein